MSNAQCIFASLLTLAESDRKQISEKINFLFENAETAPIQNPFLVHCADFDLEGPTLLW